MTPELCQVLCACYSFWAASPVPAQQRSVCHTWISHSYRDRFGCDFHQVRLRQLADLGYLQPEYTVRGGNRRYYAIVDPPTVEKLLQQWGLRTLSVACS